MQKRTPPFLLGQKDPLPPQVRVQRHLRVWPLHPVTTLLCPLFLVDWKLPISSICGKRREQIPRTCRQDQKSCIRSFRNGRQALEDSWAARQHTIFPASGEVLPDLVYWARMIEVGRHVYLFVLRLVLIDLSAQGWGCGDLGRHGRGYDSSSIERAV